MNTKEMKVYINVLEEILGDRDTYLFLDNGRDGFSDYTKAKLEVFNENGVIRLLAVPE